MANMFLRGIFSTVLYILLFLYFPGSCYLNFLSLTSDIPVWRFAIWKHRIFFAIPRWQNFSKQAEWPATLVETVWNERSNDIIPSLSQVSVESATNECQRLRSVTGLDVDPRSRLWVLDVPNEPNYPAKVIVYELKRYNIDQVAAINLETVPTKDLKDIVVDPVTILFEYRAYIGDPGDETIIVLSLGERRWWKLKMARNVNVPRVYSGDLAISKKKSVLYVTGSSSDDLFSINLEHLRSDVGFTSNDREIEVTWVGKKLGRSLGLFCDFKGGVHYFLISERASVRWDSKFELKAENHQILLQDEAVACITDYTVDSQRNVWGLVNYECPCSSRKNFSKNFTLMPRMIKIFK